MTLALMGIAAAVLIIGLIFVAWHHYGQSAVPNDTPYTLPALDQKLGISESTKARRGSDPEALRRAA